MRMLSYAAMCFKDKRVSIWQEKEYSYIDSPIEKG